MAKKYTVSVEIKTRVHVYDVEADSEEDAKEAVYDMDQEQLLLDSDGFDFENWDITEDKEDGEDNEESDDEDGEDKE